MILKNCPKCGVNWKEENTIYEHFLIQGYSPDDAEHKASMYGCTPDNPQHFSINVIGIEVSGKYDGVSYWECQECKALFDRWSMKEVENDL